MTGIDEAIIAAGGQLQLAQALGITQQAVSAWKRAGHAPVQWVVPVEQVTGVPRVRLLDPTLVDLVTPPTFD